MKIYIGTSGWFYPWNLDRSLDWYVANSKLNSIELNASFYRFPFPNQINSWTKKGKNLRWSIKVNRRISHLFKFKKDSYPVWQAFYSLFSPMQELIDFYLFQLPPSFTPDDKHILAEFIKFSNLKDKFALEVRNLNWFTDKEINWAMKLNITWVSIDAPKFPNAIYQTSDKVYLRMHGRTDWYQYNYSQKELEEIGQRIKILKPKAVYIYFNNDQDMLANAKLMWHIMND
ncbi:MAG: DUF72 domain-containing protein [candidate division WOR-3 bacterium]|nr:DUF72 domain-containing protein [candidate division WOR-3 bacterium]